MYSFVEGLIKQMNQELHALDLEVDRLSDSSQSALELRKRRERSEWKNERRADVVPVIRFPAVHLHVFLSPHFDTQRKEEERNE